jgi:hypothetical protein
MDDDDGGGEFGLQLVKYCSVLLCHSRFGWAWYRRAGKLSGHEPLYLIDSVAVFSCSGGVLGCASLT